MRLGRSQRGQFIGESTRPAAVPQRMNLDPRAALPVGQFQCAPAARDRKVPMTASRAPRQLALASNDETTSPTFLQRVEGAEFEFEFEH
jgi:hypothetical protein